MQRLEDLNTVLGQTNDHRHRVLVAAAKNIKIWFVKVRKIKAIYHTLNAFNLDTSQKCLIAECWIPRLDMEAIQLALRRGTERSGIIRVSYSFGKSNGSSIDKHLFCRQHSCPNPERDANNGSSAYFLQDKQVHKRFPGAYQRLWSRFLPRGQSCRLHHHHFPFPLCHDVRRRWSRCHHVWLCIVHGHQGEAVDGKEVRQRDMELLLQRPLHHLLDGHLLHLHRVDLQ